MAELSWKLSEEGRFTAQGGIWNSKQTDYITCGQMVDRVAKFFPDNALVQEILQVWEVWHLKTGLPKDVIKQIKSWEKKTDD